MEKIRYIFLKIFDKINNHIAKMKNIFDIFSKIDNLYLVFFMKKESKTTDSSESYSLLHEIELNSKSMQVFGRKKIKIKKNKSVGRKTEPRMSKKALLKLKLPANVTNFQLESKLSSDGIQKKMKQNNSSNDKDVFRVAKLNNNKFLKKFYPNEKIHLNNKRLSSVSQSHHNIGFNI